MKKHAHKDNSVSSKKAPKDLYFHPHTSSGFLRAGAYLTCFAVIFIAILLLIILKPHPLIAVVIVLAALLISISLTAMSFVIANLSDDLKYIAGYLENKQEDDEQRHAELIHALKILNYRLAQNTDENSNRQ